MDSINVKARQRAPLDTPTDLTSAATKDLAGALTLLLADMFALYLKTKNFHWHMSGPHFRDYHLLLDEQADQIFAATDAIAERVRKIGGTTLRSIGQISRLQRVLDNDADYVTPHDMLAELREDNKQLTTFMRETHTLCDEHDDVASASLLENWIDEARTTNVVPVRGHAQAAFRRRLTGCAVPGVPACSEQLVQVQEIACPAPIERGRAIGGHEAIGACASESLRQSLDNESNVQVAVGATGVAAVDEADGQVVAYDQIAQGRVAVSNNDVFVRSTSAQPIEQSSRGDVPVARRECPRIDLTPCNERRCPPQSHRDAFVEGTVRCRNGVQRRQRTGEGWHDNLGGKISFVGARSLQGLAQDRNEIASVVQSDRPRDGNAALSEPRRALDFLP